MTESPRSDLDRRSLLGGLGALGVGSLLTPAARGAAAPLRTPIAIPKPPAFLAGAGPCALTPSGAEGPFYLPLQLLKQDITSGMVGLPLTLIFQLRDSQTCQPIQGAAIDLWHCSTGGQYSGFASEGTLGQDFHRGYQVTDAGGLVIFQTVYPGWYPGRTAHLHLKVYLNGTQDVLTTQTYFLDALSNFVYTNIAPYDQKGPNPTSNQADALYVAQNQMPWIVAPGGGGVWAGTLLVV